MCSNITLLLHNIVLQEHTGTSFTGSQINDIRVVGFIVVTLLLMVALIGLDFEAYVSNVEQSCSEEWVGTKWSMIGQAVLRFFVPTCTSSYVHLFLTSFPRKRM